MAEPIETEPNLLPYLRLFWAHRRILFRAAIVSAIASLLLALLIPAQYQSVTRLMPPDTQRGDLSALVGLATRLGADNGGLGSLTGDYLGIKSSGALFIGIVNSQTAQDRLIDEFNLKKVYRVSKIEDARRALTEHTSVSEDRKSGIITIAVTDHDPKRAATLAQAYVLELNELVSQLSTSSARRERIFLEGRLAKVRDNLDDAEKNFSEFASKNAAIDVPAQAKAMVEAAATLQGQLIATQAQLSALQQVFTDNNVRVRQAEARVQELQSKLNEIGGAGTPEELRQDNSLYPSIRKLPLLGVTYADLYRQTKIQETVYELLTQQYELAKVQEAKEIPTVKVLDPALTPTEKSFPPRTLVAILGTLFGIALVMIWLVTRNRWEALEADDPRRVFASEVFEAFQARVSKFSFIGAWPGHYTSPTSSESHGAGQSDPLQDGRHGKEVEK